MLLQGGWMFADLFVAPSFAHAAPEILDGQSPARLSAGFLAAWFANTSFILLGIASLRARVLPITSSIALILAGALTVIPLPVDGPAYEVGIGVAAALAGARGLRNRTATRDQLESAEVTNRGVGVPLA